MVIIFITYVLLVSELSANAPRKGPADGRGSYRGKKDYGCGGFLAIAEKVMRFSSLNENYVNKTV